MYVYTCMHLPGPVLSRYSLGHCDTQIPALPLCLLWASFCHSFLGREQPSGSVPSGECVKQEGTTVQAADLHQDTAQAANASPQLGWHSCAPSARSHAQLHTASHRGLTRTSQHLETSADTTERYFKPRGVTPDRLRSVLCALAEGRGYFTLYTFYQNNLKPGLLTLPDK